MSKRYPRIRLRDGIGRLVIRDGLHISFFMKEHHRVLAPAMLRAIEAYRGTVGPEALQWCFGLDEDPQPLDDKLWELLQHHMLHVTRDTIGCLVELWGDLKDVSGFMVNYCGHNPRFPKPQTYPNEVSGISFWLPTEYLEDKGPGAVRELALRLAAELPFNSGYASLAFNTHDWGWSTGGREINRLSSRYLGLDAHRLTSAALRLGTRLRGAYWLNFLGQPALGELGGAEELRARLSPAISVETLAPDKVLVQVGEWPLAGDVAQGEDMSLYRELAHVLEPCLHMELNDLYDFSPEDMTRWLRRFLD